MKKEIILLILTAILFVAGTSFGKPKAPKITPPPAVEAKTAEQKVTKPPKPPSKKCDPKKLASCKVTPPPAVQ